MSQPASNLRYELRAYEAPNACRLASILQDLASERSVRVPRDAVAAHWAQRYPRHALGTGRGTIRNRIRSALPPLRVARIVQTQGNNIMVVNWDRLRIAAENLQLVEDAEGMALSPSLWPRRPAVPSHLQDAQNKLEQGRQATIQAATHE